jgi:hypothetical protein
VALNYAFANIPEDRITLQQMVDEYSVYWGDGNDGDVFQPLMQMELPKKLLLRVMRRCRVMKEVPDDEDEVNRC